MLKKTGVFVAILCAALILLLGNVFAEAADMGEYYDANGYPESMHPYAADTEIIWDYEYPETAAMLIVTFSADTALENGYDYLQIMPASGESVSWDNIPSYTGTSLSGTTLSVRGNAFRMRLVSRGSGTYYGFSIENIEPAEGEFTFTATGDDGSIVLTAMNNRESNIVFDTLTVDQNDRGNYTLKGSKVLTGKELTDGEFTFTATSDDGSVVLTATNDADGNIVFETVTVDQDGLGSYPLTFTIEELEGENGAITYDGSSFTATVTLTDDGSGTITADVVYSGEVLFENTYESEGS